LKIVNSIEKNLWKIINKVYRKHTPYLLLEYP